MRVPTRPTNGALAWWGIVAFVAAYDAWAMFRDHPTLSTAFRDASRHVGWRWLVLPVWLITSLHLFGLIPARYDPFGLYALALRPIKTRCNRRS